jgi:hypothetical protein
MQTWAVCFSQAPCTFIGAGIDRMDQALAVGAVLVAPLPSQRRCILTSCVGHQARASTSVGGEEASSPPALPCCAQVMHIAAVTEIHRTLLPGLQRLQVCVCVSPRAPWPGCMLYPGVCVTTKRPGCDCMLCPGVCVTTNRPGCGCRGPWLQRPRSSAASSRLAARTPWTPRL